MEGEKFHNELEGKKIPPKNQNCVFIKAFMEVQSLIYIVMGQEAMIFPQQRNKRAVMANINLLLHLGNKIYDTMNKISKDIPL